MKFQLLGREVEISEGRKNYLKIVQDYKIMAEQAEKDFREDYERIFGLVFLNSTYAEKFMDTYARADHMDKLVGRYVTKTRQYLLGYGVYDLSDKEIWDKGIVTEERSVSQLQYAFNEFFVDCLDLGSDGAGDDVIVPKIKAKFAGSTFTNCIYNDVMSLCDFVVCYLCDNSIAQIQFVCKDDAAKASAYFDNLKDTVLTEEQRLEIMCSIPMELSSEEFAAEYEKRIPAQIPYKEQIKMASSLIELDPRKKEYYQYIFLNLPQAKYEIAAIANYVGIDLSILIKKDISDTFDTTKICNEEDALKMREDLQACMDRYGVKEAAEQAELEKIIHDFDVKARTYDGVRYETRELRAKAEADDKELYALYAESNGATKQTYLEIIKAFEDKPYDEGIKNKHISILHGKIGEIEKAEMEELVKGLETATEPECAEIMEKLIAYETVVAQKDVFKKRIQDRVAAIWKAELDVLICGINEMTEVMCEATKEKVLAHGAPDHMKQAYLESIDKRIYSIWDAEDFERFSEIFIQTPVGDSVKVGQNCSLIEKTGRTDTKELFIKALYLLNENEVAAAAKYAIAKEGGMLSSLLNMGKKESYQILTLNGRLIHPAIEDAIRIQKEAKGNGLFGGLGKLKSTFGFGKTTTSAANTFCPNCGKPVTQGAKFCSSCGNKID